MARFRWTGIVALGCWLWPACCGTMDSLQTATSKQPREGSPLVALLRDGYQTPPPPFDVSEPVTIDNTPTISLYWYSDFTNVRAVRRLLKKGVDVNARDLRGATALHYAVSHASLPVVEVLLHRGANVNMADRWGGTPLMIASHNRDVRLIRLLLKNGARVNAHTPDGWTALTLARGKPQLVSIFLRAGSTVDVLTLTVAACGRETTPASIGALLDTGINVNARDSSGRTALFCAALNKVELVRYLLKRGADARMKDNDGRTILAVARDGGSRRLSPELVELLKKAGAHE